MGSLMFASLSGTEFGCIFIFNEKKLVLLSQSRRRIDRNEMKKRAVTQ